MHNGDIFGYVFGQKVLFYLLVGFDKTDSERVVSLNLLNKRLFQNVDIEIFPHGYAQRNLNDLLVNAVF